MNPYELEKVSQDLSHKNPGATITFQAAIQGKIIECQWLDPYFGLFVIPEIKGHGMLRLQDFIHEFPHAEFSEPRVKEEMDEDISG